MALLIDSIHNDKYINKYTKTYKQKHQSDHYPFHWVENDISKKKHKHILCGNKAKSEKGTNEPAKQRTKSTKINKFETE